jgi:hypothetical protein
MAELIASGTAEADSADFTLAAGDQATLFLKDAAGTTVNPHGVAQVHIKSADGEYFMIGKLDTAPSPPKFLPRLAPTASAGWRLLLRTASIRSKNAAAKPAAPGADADHARHF